jgi:ribose 1,5-bisphosphokinase
MNVPGRLLYVVGPSGAGKDSLLAYARERLPAAAPVVFAHRYITRPADAGGESHVALTPAEFARLRDRALFALHWESHGLSYGLGLELDAWLAAGLTVVMNGSRAHLPAAAARYGDRLQVVLIEVPPAILRARLIARARETPAQIEDRVTRAAAFTLDHPGLIRLTNAGPLAEAGEALLRLLSGHPVEA